MFSKQKALRFSRKLLASVLALVMVLVALPVVSFAADYTPTNYAGQQGQLVLQQGTWYLRDNEQRAGILFTTYQAAESDVNQNSDSVYGTPTYTYVKMSNSNTVNVNFYVSTDKWFSGCYGRIDSINATNSLAQSTSWSLSNTSHDNGSNPTGGFDIDTEFYQWIGNITLANPTAGTYNATYDITMHTTGLPWDIGTKTYTYGTATVSIVVLDKSTLAKAVDDAYALLAADSTYLTDASIANLESALATAEPMAVVDYVTDQNSINNAAAAVQNAINNATYKPADESQLTAAIDTYAATYADGGATYTDDSWKPFAAAYENALGVDAADYDIRYQAIIDNAVSGLIETAGKLVQDANYTLEQLQALTSEMQALYDQDSQYMTEECAAALAEALANADAAAKAADTGDDSLIDDAYTALEAIVVTYAPADYSALKDALAAAQAFLADSDNAANYDDAKVAALRDAVAEATQIAEGLDKRSQAMIDEVTDALTANLPTEDDLKDANYSELDALLAQAEEFLADTDSLQYYDADEVAALQAAYNDAKAIERGQTILYQSTINAAVEQLTLTMLDESDMTRANTTALREALAAANEWMASVDLNNYDSEKVAALQTAVETGQTLLDSNPAVIYQNDVNAAAQAITDAMLTDDDLKDANYDTFNALLEQAQAVLADETTAVNYNADAVAALQTAVDAAAAVEAGQKITYQPTIDAAAQAIADAMLTDEDLNPADYTTFSALLEQAKALLEDETTAANYEADAIAALQAAYDDAVANVLYDQNILYQPTLDGYAQAIVDAMLTDDDLKPADLADLEAAIEAGEAALAEEGSRDNTVESLNVLRSALYVAEGLRDGHTTILDQSAINAAAAAIYTAINGLTLKQANYDGLAQAIADAQMLYDTMVATSNYEETALQAYAEAIAAAQQILDNEPYNIRQQAEVDAAAATLKAAAPTDDDLKPADMSELEAAIQAAEAIMNAADYGEYTAYTRTAMEAALADARSMAATAPNILQQAEVSNAAAMLNAAMAALVKAEASYDALDAAVAEAEALLDDTTLADRYTNDSIAALQAAVDAAKAIDRHLPADQQAAVDSAAQAVTGAMDALAAYNKVTGVQITDANGNVIDGDVYYVKAKWYDALYSNVSTDLGVQISTGADVASVTWEYANWSIDEPEANITPSADGYTAHVKPNGKGIGARSCWVKVIVTDVNGNTVEDTIKVRFYKWNWQK